MGMATIMARLSTLEVALAQSQAENYMGRAELEKVRMENVKLREALIAPQYEDEEADTYAAVPGTGVQAMPESFLMTPQKPPAPSPLSEGDWATEWEQLPANPPGFARDGPAQLPGTSWWTKSVWEREPWCTPAWGTAWQSPPQCDPWSEYRANAADADRGRSTYLDARWPRRRLEQSVERRLGQPMGSSTQGAGPERYRPARKVCRRHHKMAPMVESIHQLSSKARLAVARAARKSSRTPRQACDG